MIKQKSFTYDFIKIITTILVVIAHAARMYTNIGAITPTNQSSVLNEICNFIYSFHMPLFICVSGMVYGLCVDDLGKYKEKKAFIKNKFNRLLIPYFSFGILYVTPSMVLLGLTEQSFGEYLFQGIILVQNSRHLWFLMALFMIFIFIMLFQKILNKMHVSLILLLLLIISYYSHLVPKIFGLHYFLYYLLFFYIGKLLNSNYLIIKGWKNIIMIGAGFNALLGLYSMDYILLKILCALLGISIVIGATQYANPKIQESIIFKKLKLNSFGIYLFHPMIIYWIFHILGDKNIYPFVLFTISIVISFSLSYVLTELFRKLKLGIFIGEK